ncbi:hypothetical protein [Streptomyces resistomycificus]|nr:hypothetical protein [Streptomyces resistomycificus]
MLRRLLIPAAVLGAVLLTAASAQDPDIGWDAVRVGAPTAA